MHLALHTTRLRLIQPPNSSITSVDNQRSTWVNLFTNKIKMPVFLLKMVIVTIRLMLRTPLLTLRAMLRVTAADQFSVSRTKSKSSKERAATKINKLISGLTSIKLILPFQTSKPFQLCNTWEERTCQMDFWDVRRAIIRARRSLSVTFHVTVPWAMGMLAVNHIMVILMSSLKRKPRNSSVSTLIAQVANTVFKRINQLKTSLPSRDISKTCLKASSSSRSQKTLK